VPPAASQGRSRRAGLRFEAKKTNRKRRMLKQCASFFSPQTARVLNKEKPNSLCLEQSLKRRPDAFSRYPRKAHAAWTQFKGNRVGQFFIDTSN